MGHDAAPRRVWCEFALLPGGLAERVLISVTAGRIAQIELDTDPPPGVDRRPGVTVPGIANAHSHAFHRVLRHRSQLGHGSFWTWRDQMFAVAESLDPESYHRVARAVFAEMSLAGITTVGEFHYLHHGPNGMRYTDGDPFGDALIAAASDVGIRITLLDTLYLHGGLDRDGHRPLEGAQRRFGDHSVDEWAARVELRADGHLHRSGAAVHSVRAVDPASIAAAARLTEAMGLPLHAHVSEQSAENEACLAHHGTTPVDVFASAGALGPSFTAVHAIHLSDADVAALGRTASTICVCATTERDLGDGVAPARSLLDAGVHLSIGTDSHAVIDPFEEARAIELDERLVRGVRGVVDIGDLLAAWSDGHRALGWTDCGTIAVGAAADLVTVSLDSPRTAGGRPDAVLPSLVFGATASDVTHVMVDGIDVVSSGRHRSIDVATELAGAISAVLDGSGGIL